MHRSRRTLTLPAILGLVTVAALAAPTSGGRTALAARPAPTAPPAPVDGGWIYSDGNSLSTPAIFRTSTDGASTTVVAGAPADYGAPPGEHGSVGVPSQQLHDGSRWYLAATWWATDIVFPVKNQTAVEIDAVREGETAGLQLTTNRASCILPWGRIVWGTDASGTPDRSFSFPGAQWADQDASPGCETFVGSFVYRADLVYDGGGAIVGATALAPVAPLPSNASFEPEAYGIAWSPDAATLAYTMPYSGATAGLWLATPGSPLGSHTRIVAGRYYNIDWSPDQSADAGLQTTIAFTGWNNATKVKGGVWGVQPNGSGLRLLAEAVQSTTSSKPSHIHYTPFWSPTGSHLAFVDLTTGGTFGFLGRREIRRMQKDGTGNTVLATESAALDFSYLLGWTE